MLFPVTLYHKDHDVFVRSGYRMYPIVVSSQEEYDALEPGWHSDPVKASAYGTDIPAEEANGLDEGLDDVDRMIEEENESDEEVPRSKKSVSRKRK